MIATLVVMAIVAFAFMVMMMTHEIQIHRQFTGQPVFHHCTDWSRHAADNQYARLLQGVDGATTDTATNQNGHFLIRQQSCQSAMAAVAAGFHAFRKNLTVFHVKNSKFRRMPEMLKHRPIFTRDCYFHINRHFSKLNEFTPQLL